MPQGVGLIGDYNPPVIAHVAIPQASALAGQAAGCAVAPLFQPERSAFSGTAHPLITAYVRAVGDPRRLV